MWTEHDAFVHLCVLLSVALLFYIGTLFPASPWVRDTAILIASCLAGSVEVASGKGHGYNRELVA